MPSTSRSSDPIVAARDTANGVIRYSHGEADWCPDEWPRVKIQDLESFVGPWIARRFHEAYGIEMPDPSQSPASRHSHRQRSTIAVMRASHVDRMAARAARNLLDACEIHRYPTDAEDIEPDPVTLELNYGDPVEIWSGPCSIVATSPTVGPDDIGIGIVDQVSTVQIRIPMTAPLPEPGDIVVITDSRDPEMIGRELIVRPDSRQTMGLTRHLVAEWRERVR